MLGPRPDRHRAHRGAYRRIAPELLHRHRHPFDAAGGARFATHRLLPSGHSGRGRRHRRHLHRAQGQAHSGLHYRPLRLTAEIRTMSDHIVKAYDEDLANLKTMLAQMGGLAEDHLAKAIDALSKRDTKLADVVIAQDEKIDALELQIDERPILTIARRQPMARDLREIMVAIRIASDLERIGDLAKNIAKRTHAISEQPP